MHSTVTKLNNGKSFDEPSNEGEAFYLTVYKVIPLRCANTIHRTAGLDILARYINLNTLSFEFKIIYKISPACHLFSPINLLVTNYKRQSIFSCFTHISHQL